MTRQPGGAATGTPLASVAGMSNAKVLSNVQRLLDEDRVHDALRLLNSRTPHRFTGIYRYEGEVLRNLYLFDVFNPAVTTGSDVPMIDAYCANVGRSGKGIEFRDVARERQIEVKSTSPVVSYCGALIRDADGEPYGTLCHYDLKPCDTPTSDLPLLEELAPRFYQALVRGGAAAEAGLIL